MTKTFLLGWKVVSVPPQPVPVLKFLLYYNKNSTKRGFCALPSSTGPRSFRGEHLFGHARFIDKQLIRSLRAKARGQSDPQGRLSDSVVAWNAMQGRISSFQRLRLINARQWNEWIRRRQRSAHLQHSLQILWFLRCMLHVTVALGQSTLRATDTWTSSHMSVKNDRACQPCNWHFPLPLELCSLLDPPCKIHPSLSLLFTLPLMLV